MKKYYKNNKEVKRPFTKVLGNKTIKLFNDNFIKKCGFEIKEVSTSESEKTILNNDIVRKQRQIAYKTRADQYFIAYRAYTELGKTNKAKEMKELWIKEREIIDKQYPYIEE